MSTITPSIEEGLKFLARDGYVTMWYSGDLSTAAQDAATAAVKEALSRLTSPASPAKL